MGGQTLARGAHSRIRSHPPPRASTDARDHSLFATAARVLGLEASSTYLWNKLLNLFSRSGPPGLAHRLFRSNARAGRRLVQHPHRAPLPLGRPARARVLADAPRGRWREADGTTLSALLALPHGGDAASRGFVRQLHSHAVRLGLCSNAFVGSALVRAYERCGDTGAIEGVFGDITEPDVVCWNVMIDACTRGGSLRRAVEVLSRMRRAGGVADGFTLATILKACSREEDLGLGVQLHACAWKVGFHSETATCNALITMYLKCGVGMNSAVKVFDRISEQSIITWTAMIAGLVQNGLAVEAVRLYKEMVRAGEGRMTTPSLACSLHLVFLQFLSMERWCIVGS